MAGWVKRCIFFGGVPFSHFQPCSFLPSSLWGYKNWVIMGGWAKR